MSAFDDLLDEYTGNVDAITDLRACVRFLYFYDFDGAPVRIWAGQGRLFTIDGNEWLGSVDGNGKNYHTAPALQDGRDGTSATYEFGLTIPDLPGVDVGETYEQLKGEQWRVVGRRIVVYMAIFNEGEALRPETPIAFVKELFMLSPKFNEYIDGESGGVLQKVRKVSVTAKDDNAGRNIKPGGTYTDTVQKQRAKQQGVAVDRGCEFVARLANRTYVLP
jgi:hypothetical protein